MTRRPSFTPGPWYAKEVAMGFTSIHAEADDSLVFALAHPNAKHGDKQIPEEEKYANLRLMTAAPELLAACKLALGAFERNDAINWDDLQRAIEKAEGA